MKSRGRGQQCGHDVGVKLVPTSGGRGAGAKVGTGLFGSKSHETLPSDSDRCLREIVVVSSFLR